MKNISRISLGFALGVLTAALPACSSDDGGGAAVDAAVDAAVETIDGEGCEHLAEGPAVAVTAAADAASADTAVVADDHRRYDIAFVATPGNGAGGSGSVDAGIVLSGGAVTFASDADGEFHFFFDAPVDYTITDASGAEVNRESSAAGTETCDIVRQWDVYDLTVGTFTLTFEPTPAAGVKLVIEPAGATHDHG